MAKVLVSETNLENIADSIRAKNGTQNTYTPAQMSSAIDSLPSGSGGDISDYYQATITSNTSASSKFAPDIFIKSYPTVEVDENVTNLSYAFSGFIFQKPLKIVNEYSNVNDTSNMFSACSTLKNIDLSGFNTSNVTKMSSMFSGCNGLTSLDVGKFNTSNVTTMASMFNSCSGLTSLNLSNFNTNKVTTMVSMFSSCTGLTNLNLSNFNTSSVTFMGSMFSGCSGLTKLDLSSFNASNVTNNRSIFANCSNLNALIINNPNLFKISTTTAFTNTPIASGTGYVYVPDNMVDTYKSATNWSTYASQIKGMSELPS